MGKSKKQEYADYLASPAWTKVKQAFYAIHPRACAICGSKTKLHLHHKTYLHIFEELEHLEDLICFCAHHHRKAHDPQPVPTTKSGRRRERRRERLRERRAESDRHHEDSKKRFGQKREPSAAEQRRTKVLAGIVRQEKGEIPKDLPRRTANQEAS